MDEITLQLLSLAMDSGYILYVFLWCTACGLFAALAPPSVTARVPNIIMVIINVSALNLGRAANALTDLRGNAKNGNSKGNSEAG